MLKILTAMLMVWILGLTLVLNTPINLIEGQIKKYLPKELKLIGLGGTIYSGYVSELIYEKTPKDKISLKHVKWHLLLQEILKFKLALELDIAKHKENLIYGKQVLSVSPNGYEIRDLNITSEIPQIAHKYSPFELELPKRSRIQVKINRLKMSFQNQCEMLKGQAKVYLGKVNVPESISFLIKTSAFEANLGNPRASLSCKSGVYKAKIKSRSKELNINVQAELKANNYKAEGEIILKGDLRKKLQNITNQDDKFVINQTGTI